MLASVIDPWLEVHRGELLELVRELVSFRSENRPPHGEDVMAYLVRADFALPHLVAHGRLDGWFPRFYLGYQEFLFNGPGVAWAMGAARGMTLGALSNAGALKVVGVMSFAALPVAMAFLARSLGLGRLAAGIAAVLSLLVSSESCLERTAVATS